MSTTALSEFDRLRLQLLRKEMDRLQDLRFEMIHAMLHATTFHLLGHEMVVVPATTQAKRAAAAWVRKWRKKK